MERFAEAPQQAPPNQSTPRILYIPLEFSTWQDARYWAYLISWGIEDALISEGSQCFTIPAFFGVSPDDPTSWLHHAEKLCEGKTFDQVWFTANHTPLNERLLRWLEKVAPVRVGLFCESLQITEEEWQTKPGPCQQRQDTVDRCLSIITHAIVVDEADVDFLTPRNIPAYWFPPCVPFQSITDASETPPSMDKAAFYGAVYGKRKSFLENPLLTPIFCRPEHSLEEDTDLPATYNKLQVAMREALLNPALRTEETLRKHLELHRSIRKACFSLWIKTLRNAPIIVNLPQYGFMYSGRVAEAMAAGRPVISWRIPNRPQSKELFVEGKEILLFDQDSPEQLCRHIQNLLNNPQQAEQIAGNARKKLLSQFTVEKQVHNILRWTSTISILCPTPKSTIPPQPIKQPISSQYSLDFIHDFNQRTRDQWVIQKAATVPADTRILDVGAGTCPYQKFFSHCDYKAHDFKKYTGVKLGGTNQYGQIDYVSEITSIPVPDASFDVILCTEVLEHVPEPGLAIQEMVRILRPGGRLLLTAPLGSGLHQLPFHYYGGYSPEWYRYWATKLGLSVVEITPNGGFFRQLAQECNRAASILGANPQLPVENTPEIRRLLSEQLPQYFFAVENNLFIDQFTIGYHVELGKPSK